MPLMPRSAMVALAALLLCSACGSTTTTRFTPAAQQLTAIKWEEAVAATSTAQVNNTSLIFMR